MIRRKLTNSENNIIGSLPCKLINQIINHFAFYQDAPNYIKNLTCAVSKPFWSFHKNERYVISLKFLCFNRDKTTFIGKNVYAYKPDYRFKCNKELKEWLPILDKKTLIIYYNDFNEVHSIGFTDNKNFDYHKSF